MTMGKETPPTGKPRKPLPDPDRTLDEAIRRGEFDDLPGKGKPLQLDTSPDAVYHALLKQANYVPEWAELSQEIDALIRQGHELLESFAAEHAAVLEALSRPVIASERAEGRRRSVLARLFGSRSDEGGARGRPGEEDPLAQLQRRWSRSLARYASLLHGANRKIRRFNDVVPLPNRQRGPIPVAERLEAFAERFPLLERAPDGSLAQVRGTVPEALVDPQAAKDRTGAKRDLARG